MAAVLCIFLPGTGCPTPRAPRPPPARLPCPHHPNPGAVRRGPGGTWGLDARDESARKGPQDTLAPLVGALGEPDSSSSLLPSTLRGERHCPHFTGGETEAWQSAEEKQMGGPLAKWGEGEASCVPAPPGLGAGQQLIPGGGPRAVRERLRVHAAPGIRAQAAASPGPELAPQSAEPHGVQGASAHAGARSRCPALRSGTGAPRGLPSLCGVGSPRRPLRVEQRVGQLPSTGPPKTALGSDSEVRTPQRSAAKAEDRACAKALWPLGVRAEGTWEGRGPWTLMGREGQGRATRKASSSHGVIRSPGTLQGGGGVGAALPPGESTLGYRGLRAHSCLGQQGVCEGLGAAVQGGPGTR